ncbi:MAG: hypothetical protein F6K30_29320, partial [Cyanothece sp. SIO2G6]|nr:hypothetical protein [Cyanothece sp. SIO2G6]
MGINLPVESQPLAIAIPAATVMLCLSGWLGWCILQGLRHSWQNVALRHTLQLFYLLLVSLLLQSFAIVYILDKDITAIPRYNFISYPVLLPLFAIGLTREGKRQKVEGKRQKAEGRRQKAGEKAEGRRQKAGEKAKGRRQKAGEKAKGRRQKAEQKTPNSPTPPLPYSPTPSLPHSPTSPLPHSLTPPLLTALLAGLLSTCFVVHGIVFQKGYHPHQVAQDMTQFPEQSLLVAVSYQSLQEVALGLSFALEVEKRYPQLGETPAHFIFIDRSNSYADAWQQLRLAPHALSLPLNLWAIASPGMKTKDYPPTLTVRRPNRKARVTCAIAPDYFHRIGFPYQLFQCPLPQRNQ